MKFCVECGEKLAENVKFCTNCGTKVNSAVDEISEETPSEEHFPNAEQTKEHAAQAGQKNELTTQTQGHEQAVQVSAPPLTKEQLKARKKRNIFIAAIAILLLALFGVHKGLAHYFDPMNELKALDDAITNNDAQTFLSYIEFADDALLDEASYFDYIKKEVWADYMKPQLRSIIENNQDNANPLDEEIYDAHGEAIIKVKKAKKIFLYPTYHLVAIPTELHGVSNLPDTTVTILEQEFSLAQEETILTKIYQGNYDIKATANNEYGAFEYEDTILVESYPTDFLDIEFATYTADIYYDDTYADAILYINGKSTEKKLKELETLGPLPADAQMKLYAVWKDREGNELLSKSIEISDTDDLYGSLYFEFDERNRLLANDLDHEEVGQFILEFREAYEDAVNYVDFAFIQDYLKPGSAAEKGLREFVKDMEDGYYYYEFLENTVISVKEKGKNKYEVKTNEKFEFTDDDWKRYAYDRDKLYHVELVDDRWQIVKIDYLDTKKKTIN